MTIGKGSTTGYLDESDVKTVVAKGFETCEVTGKRVLVIIPDGTRTAPIPLLFRAIHEVIGASAAALDYLIALGTHQAMNDEAIARLVGASAQERATAYPGIQVYNHRWDDPAALTTLGVITAEETALLTDGLMNQSLAVTINRMILDYHLLVICGPTFPHEVVGFSGGNKYFFPGISGPEVINFSHWLGALLTSSATIGVKDTPIRRLIDRAASMIPGPKLCFAMVVKQGAGPDPGLAGLYAGSPEEAFSTAADLSAQVHIRWIERPFRRVLAIMPEMYDDLWVGGKGMYKLEPVIADGGEVVIYAPHITEVSYTHGAVLDEVGYHCRDYFTAQWDRFSRYPAGVLAHSTHVRGLGTYDPVTGEEKPRVRVTLATGIPEERCHRLNLGYLDPASVNRREWEGREAEGILVVPKAGELLYRLRRE
jgi:nickel-dependent lactate racemase